MERTNERAVRAKNDPALLEDFIRENRKFILGCAGRVCGRFITDEDDESAIAMEAFYEAVQSFEEDKGRFDSFAALVIERRITDYQRKESRHYPEIPVEPFTLSGETQKEEETALQHEVRQKTEELSAGASAEPGGNDTLHEIQAMQDVLGTYGFSFYELTECSPKSEKTKKQCAAAIRALLGNAVLHGKMREKKTLPMKELSKASGVKTKVLDRHRKYIIASAEILLGEYPILAEYLKYVREAVS